MPRTSAKRALVIVESPAKAKTINKYLGSGYEVKASMGHVRDLPSKGINVDIENNFEPTYEISPGKRKTVSGLKAAAKKCDTLYLATDLDREGEAIAWHLAQILGFKDEKTYRVIFNAITKAAIQSAFARPGKLDNDKVMAQQARRILDRIVGYQISPLLWKKVAKGLSAGRVQSVAVKIIVLREREIRGFRPQEYWLLPSVFSSDLGSDYRQQWLDFITPKNESDKGSSSPRYAGAGPSVAEQNDWLARHRAFRADLYEVAGKKFHADSESTAKRIFDALAGAKFSVAGLEKKESTSRPLPPFITSTLQQAAANRLGFSAKRTMSIAQQLYEGIELGDMGSLGLITYMRTDSVHMSPESISEARSFIARQFGADYLPPKSIHYAAAKSAQQAHESIHPTDVDLTPEDIKSLVSADQYKLYDLIWRRFVACQMAPAKWDVTNVQVAADTSAGRCVWRTTGRTLMFDGFTKVWQTSSEQQQLPALKRGQGLAAVDIRAEQHFTKPPARYNEASLVKSLEKEGIGRPSTYASIISTIQDRGYVAQKERKFHATELGEVVTDKLDEYFPRIMDVAFTRHMEEQLDKIEDQHLDWLSVLNEFYGPFKENLEKASEQMKHAKAETRPSEYSCPDCGKGLVYRFGKSGTFLGCSGFPACKFTSPCDDEGKMIQEQRTEHKCPKCGKAMVVKRGRYGAFLGCSGYPECKTVLNLDKQGNIKPPKAPPEPTGIRCHKCKEGELVIRKSRRGPFLGCNRYPKCRTIVSIKQLEELKQLQAEGKWPPKSVEEAAEILGKEKTARKSTKRRTKRAKKKTATSKS
jgi:DNA topoisomerase-1